MSNTIWFAFQQANKELGGNVPVERNKLPQDLAQDVAMVNLGHKTNLLSSSDMLLDHPEVFLKPCRTYPLPLNPPKQASKQLTSNPATSKPSSK